MDKTLFKDRTTLGAVVIRTQVPYLTESHKNMLNTVKQRHSRMLILLGVSDKIEFSNAFSFDFRRQMLNSELREHDVILPLLDEKDDNKVWVERVDVQVQSLLSPGETAIIYGGRDSFIPYYKNDGGKFATQELLPEDNDSGTELRSIGATKTPIYSVETANALLWLLKQLEAQGAILYPQKTEEK